MLIKSAKTIESAMAKGVPTQLHDGDGMFLDIRSKSSASWVLRYTCLGVRDEMGLGSLRKVGLAEARELRTKYLKMVGQDENPKKTRRTLKLENIRQANAPKKAAIGQFVRDNIDVIAKKAGPKQKAAWIESLQEGRIGSMAKKLPHEVTDLDAIILMKDYYERSPVMADDVRQRLYRVLNVAVKVPGWSNPFRWDGHLEDEVVRKTEEESHPSLAHALIGEFMNGLRGENERPLMALALEWLIISANRADEACSADWSEIEWDLGEDGCWVIPEDRMKMRREHVVPLTDRHHEILAKLKPLGCKEFPASGPIFPSPVKPGKSISVTGLRKFLLSRRRPDGGLYIDPLRDNRQITLHGFRATFRTWGESQKNDAGTDHLYSEKLLEGCIAHAVGTKTRRVYIRTADAEIRRHIMQTWAAYCGVIQAVKPAPMRLRKAA